MTPLPTTTMSTDDVPTRAQSKVSSPRSTSSSLSYLSETRTCITQQPERWTPRRRHAPPPDLPANRRAHSYTDLFPFEVSQLAAVLSHGPRPGTPRDGAVWETYVAHTNDRIALLGPKLRATQGLPSFLARSNSQGLCVLHRRLNIRPLEDIFEALRFEAEVRRISVWEPVALAGGLSASQTQLLTLIDEIQALWLTPQEFQKKFNRPPKGKFACQSDGCVACILARMGGDVEIATALGGLLLGSMRKPSMLSTRVCWCREWIRYTVEGDVDDVEEALAEMERVGTRLRNARRWARERLRGVRGDEDEGLGLGGQSKQRETPGEGYGRQRALTACHQSPNRSTSSFPIPHEQEGQKQSGARNQTRASATGRQSSTQSDPSTQEKLYQFPKQENLRTGHGRQGALTEGQQHPSQSHSPHHHSPQPSPLFQREQQRQNRGKQAVRSAASTNSNASQIDRPFPCRSSSLITAVDTAVRLSSLTPASPSSCYSEYSEYSEYSANPFADPEVPLMPTPAHLPPDLPFRLFDWRRVDGVGGQAPPISPQRPAVQWPTNLHSPQHEIIVDRFSDGHSLPPTLSSLSRDRNVGALWRRRMERQPPKGQSETKDPECTERSIVPR